MDRKARLLGPDNLSVSGRSCHRALHSMYLADHAIRALVQFELAPLVQFELASQGNSAAHRGTGLQAYYSNGSTKL